MDIKEIDGRTKKQLRKTRVIKLYDNKIGQVQLWEGSSLISRQAIQNIYWRSIIRSQVLIVRDINAHSPLYNFNYHQRQNAGSLKELIETYKLLVSNNIDFSIRPGSLRRSIIDLALTSLGLGVLYVWEIPKEYPSLFDYKLIFLKWEDMEKKEL